jgi:hypothetical protein
MGIVTMVDFGGSNWRGRTGGRVGGGVWSAGKRVEPLLGGCFGGGVKGDKANGITAGR